MNSKSKGKLVLYTGSSGVGKGTIMAELLKRNPNIRLSVSNTCLLYTSDAADE